MAKIVRYNGNLVPFASASLGTERTIFGEVTQADDITSQYTADFLRGWGIVGPSDQPTLQDFNAVSYTHGQILSYLHQMGVAEYNAAQEYHIGSVTQTGGVLYISLANTNVGNTPSTSPSQWRSISGQATETVAGIAEIATQAEVTAATSDTLMVTPLKLQQRLTNYIVQATETVFGWLKLATSAQAVAGVDDQTAITPLKLGQMLPYRGFVEFKTPGAATWTVPSGVKKCWVEVIGGGGSGGYYALATGPSGGAGGGVAKKLVDLAGATSVSITVGAGGVSQTVLGTNGNPGGNSSFGAFCSATGGGPGLIGGNASVPGVGTGGDINYNLGAGSPAVLMPPVGSPNLAGGYGGGGESVCAVSGGSTPTQAGMGGGGRSAGGASTAGAPGAVRIWY